jgi:hypothetical protein
MTLDGADRDEQPSGDLGVRQVFGKGCQHVSLAS